MRSSTTVLSCGSVRIDRLDPWLGPAGRGPSDCADEVTLSRKGAKSPACIPGLRSTGTKAKTHTGRCAIWRQHLEACRRELAESQEHLAEALEQQTATSEVLQVISSFPGDLEPVFQSMLENATRICDAQFGNLYLCEEDAFRIVAMHGAAPAYAEARKHNPLVRPPRTRPLVVLPSRNSWPISPTSRRRGPTSSGIHF